MPRGTCDHCEERDAFLHGTPSANKMVFICAPCLALHNESDDCQNGQRANLLSQGERSLAPDLFSTQRDQSENAKWPVP